MLPKKKFHKNKRKKSFRYQIKIMSCSQTAPFLKRSYRVVSGVDETDSCGNNNVFNSCGKYAIWIILIPLIVALILWLIKPNFVLERDVNGVFLYGRIDWSRLILWTVIISIVIYIILWLLFRCCSSKTL